jgi:hypothetical protein
MRTMKELAQKALDCQDAVNLSGVVHSFSRAITELWEIARAEGWEGTAKINRHPVCLLFSSKIASLTYSESSEEFHKAYEWAKDLTSPPIDETETSEPTENEQCELCGKHHAPHCCGADPLRPY